MLIAHFHNEILCERLYILHRLKKFGEHPPGTRMCGCENLIGIGILTERQNDTSLGNKRKKCADIADVGVYVNRKYYGVLIYTR